MSVDGKISTGDTDGMDFDTDLPQIPGLREGLHQYYDIEKTTDTFSLITGRVLAKIGINEKTDVPEKIQVHFIIIDNNPHLTTQGVEYMAKKGNTIVIVTTNMLHPGFQLSHSNGNIKMISYTKVIDFHDLFVRLLKEYGAERITIQSGGTLNATLLNSNLIDRVLLVVTPVLIGGQNTPAIIDGESLHTHDDLRKLKTLQLVQCKKLDHSYLLLEYIVNNEI